MAESGVMDTSRAEEKGERSGERELWWQRPNRDSAMLTEVC